MADNRDRPRTVSYEPTGQMNGRVKSRIMRLLSDGMEHTRTELHGCLDDELSPERNVSPHIFHLRKELRPQGLVISVRKYGGVYYYQLRRLKGRVE